MSWRQNRDLKRDIEKERLKKRMEQKANEPRWWFPDMAIEPEEWRAFRKEAQPLEREHLERRVLLRDAEAAFRAEPEDEDLKARVRYLKKRLEDLDKKAPWISSDVPTEIALWGVPESCA